MSVESFDLYLSERLKAKYEECLNDDFDSVRIMMSEDLEKISKDVNSNYKELIRQARRYKRTYIEKYIKNKNSEINKKLAFVRQEYQDVLNGKKPMEDFKAYFGSVEEYEKELLKDIEEWKENDEMLLSQCPFLKELHKLSIKSVFKNDIKILYCRFIKENKIKDANVKRFPSLFSDMPIDTTNRLKFIDNLDNDDVIKNLFKMKTIDKVINNNDSKLIIKLENDLYNSLVEDKDTKTLMTQIALLKAMKAMNDMDKQIISYFFNIFYMYPMEDTIVKYTHEIAEGCNYSKSKNNLTAIENCIIKLSKIRLEHTVKVEGIVKKIVGTLIEANIEQYENSKNKVEVKCGSFLQELIITNSSYNFNKESFDALNKDSQQFAIWFQKRRISKVYEMKDNYYEDVYDDIAIEEAMKAILWNTTILKKKVKRIKEALDDLKNNELVIKDWKYNSRSQVFSVLYIPLPMAVVKTIHEKKFIEGSFVEG